MAWLALTIRIAASELARAEALLRLAGAQSLSIGDAADAPLLEPDPGTTPLWPTLTLRALFDGQVDRNALLAVLGPLAGAATEFTAIDDAVVDSALRQAVEPIEIGPRLKLVAADDPAARGRTAGDPAAGDPAAGDGRELALHMGLAFGTGRHPTTRLCLEWIEAELPPGGTVLDYGCGSGVLALAALRTGARHATAVDTEPQALAATRANAVLNGLESRIDIVPPDALAPGSFDVILANILAEPLVALAPAFAERQPPCAQIVLSGILTAQSERVGAAYARWYESPVRREADGWVLLTARRRRGYDR